MLKVVLIVAVLTGTAHADKGDRWDGVMIAEQAGGGILGGVALGVAGAFAGAAIADAKDSSNWYAGMAGIAFGGIIGATAGGTIGVKVTGDIRGGNGNWLATAGGALGGGILTIATMPLYIEKAPTPVAIGIATVTMLGPTIIAYHLSTDENVSTEKRVVVPLVLAAF